MCIYIYIYIYIYIHTHTYNLLRLLYDVNKVMWSEYSVNNNGIFALLVKPTI